MVIDRHKGRHRSMLGNSNIIRDVNQSVIFYILLVSHRSPKNLNQMYYQWHSLNDRYEFIVKV